MKEDDPLAFRADPGCFVDQPDAGCAATRECGIDVVHRKTHVMDPRTAPSDEATDRRIRVLGLQELDERIAGNQADDARAIGVIEWHDRKAEYVTIKRKGIAKGRHGDADMCNAGAAWGLRHDGERR